MSEFQPISNLERGFIMGKEKSIESSIEKTAKKINQSKILEKDLFPSEQDRTNALDLIVSSIRLSDGDIGFSSYEKLVNIRNDPNAPLGAIERSDKVFDVLRRSFPMAINTSENRELQTILYTGGIRDVLPKGCFYDNDGHSDLDMVKGIKEVIITNPEIRGKVKELEENKLYKRANTAVKSGKDIKAEVIENKVVEIMEMDVPVEDEDELTLFTTYLSEQAAILRGEFKTEDGSADKADVTAVLVEAVKKMTELTKEMTGIDNGKGTSSVDYEPPVFNKDTGEWEGGSRWELSPEFCAEAMKWMDHAMRWTSYTPPEWFKELPETLQSKIEYMIAVNGAAANLMYAKKDLDKVMSNDSVFGFTHAQLEILFDDDFKLVVSKMLNDLCEIGDKTTDQNGIQCLRYKEKSYYYDFNAENGDGAYTDKDGRVLKKGEPRVVVDKETPENLGKFIRELDTDVFKKIKDIKGYEESLALFFAKYKQKEANKKAINEGVAKVDGDNVWQIYKDDVFDKDKKLVHKKGDYVLDWLGNNLIVDAGKGVWEVYKKTVYDENHKIVHKKGDYVLDEDGNKKAGYLSKMNAYTAYNFFYAMGDSSLADRKRILPTFNGVISDAIRTLNPEYKARAKWQVEKSGKVRHLSDKDFLLESEYFGGPVGRYILTVAKLERDLGEDVRDGRGKIIGRRSKPIDGNKTIMEKVYDGSLNPFPDKTYYGFFDFFNTSRDLEFKNRDLDENESFNKGFSFAELMMNYGRYDDKGEFVKNESQPAFRFKSNSSTTFENEFFDSIDAAVFTGRCIMGKEKVEDLGEFGTKIMSMFGTVNGISIGKGENKIRPFSYTRSPEVIRSMLVGVFGADYGRLSSEYIPLKKQLGKKKVDINYDLFVYDVLTSNRIGLGLNANEINLNKVMRLLGVQINAGKMPSSSSFKAISSSWHERSERDKTYNLLEKQKKKSYRGEVTDSMQKLQVVFDSIKNKSVDEDYRRMVVAFERAIDFGDTAYANRLLEVMKKF